MSAAASVVGHIYKWWNINSRLTRFSKDKRDSCKYYMTAFLMGNSLMLAFGAIGAMATGQSDIASNV